jgi:hypothetical protein
MVIRSVRTAESAWQQNVTATQPSVAARQNGRAVQENVIYANAYIPIITNAIPVITFGLLPIPQNVTLTQIRVILARGNDSGRELTADANRRNAWQAPRTDLVNLRKK